MYQFKFSYHPVVFLFITCATHVQGAARGILLESDVKLIFDAARSNNVAWLAEIYSFRTKFSDDLKRLTECGRGDSLLHVAVRSGSLDVVKLHLAYDRYGYCLGSQNKERDTPLHIAVDASRHTLKRYFSMIDALLDTKGTSAAVTVKWKQKDSPLHRMKARLENLEKRHGGFESQFMRGLRQRISRMLDIALCCDYSNLSFRPLREQKIYDLLTFGANPRARTDDGSTPLHIACKSRLHLLAVDVLLSYDPLLLSEKDNDGKEPLAIMAGKQPYQYCPGEIEFLLNYTPNIHAQDNNGRTALHQACLHDNWRGINELVEAGALLDARDNEGNTPLHTLISVIRKTIICDALNALLQHGANPLLKNNEGQTVYDLLVTIEADFLEERKTTDKKIDKKMMDSFDKFLFKSAKEDLKRAEEKFVFPQTQITSAAEVAIHVHRRFGVYSCRGWTLGY